MAKMFMVNGISAGGQNIRCRRTGLYGKTIWMRKFNCAWVIETTDETLVRRNFHDCAIQEISGKTFSYEASWDKENVYTITNLIWKIGGKVTSVSECYDRSYITADIPVEYKDCFKTFDL